MDGSVLDEKSSFKMMLLSFSCKFDRFSYMFSIVKPASRDVGALIDSVKFFSSAVVLYLYKSIIRPHMKYCLVWIDSPSIHLVMLDKLLKRACKTVGPTFTASLEPQADRRISYCFRKCSFELAKSVQLLSDPLLNWIHWLAEKVAQFFFRYFLRCLG